jgi:hypothetical protein
MNVIDFFDRTRIINLASRSDRRAETDAEFAKYGFQTRTKKADYFPACCPAAADGFPSAGVRGCFLSHMTVIEEAQRDGLANVLVLEDDISFSKHILEYGAIATQALQDLDWDIAYFGHALASDPSETCWKAVDQPMLLAHFYAINGKALAGLVQFLHQVLARPPGHPDGGPMHYDGALNTFMRQNPSIKAYYFSKNLGYQRPSMTNLHEVSILDRNALLRPFAALLRQAKRAYLKRIK